MAQIKDINRIVLVCLEDARARSSFDVLEIMIQRKSRPAPRKSQRQMVFCYAHFSINTMDFYLVRSLGLSRRQWIRIRSIIHVHDVDQATTTTLRPTLYFNSQQGRRIRMQLCHGENCVQQPKKNSFKNPRIVLPRYKNSLWISPKSKVSCESIVYLISKLFLVFSIGGPDGRGIHRGERGAHYSQEKHHHKNRLYLQLIPIRHLSTIGRKVHHRTLKTIMSSLYNLYLN